MRLWRTWLRTGTWSFAVFAGATLFFVFIDGDPAFAWGLSFLTPTLLLLWLIWGLAIVAQQMARKVHRFLANTPSP